MTSGNLAYCVTNLNYSYITLFKNSSKHSTLNFFTTECTTFSITKAICRKEVDLYAGLQC